jgi:hypothetical protein
MIPSRLEGLTGETLVRLLGQLQESRTLEFKRSFDPGERGRKQLVKAVTALANTSGGDLVIGIEEKNGAVTGVPGVTVDDPDRYIRDESQRLTSGVEPPLPPFDFRPYRVAEGAWAFVLRVPRSWVGPHRSLYDKEFYVRLPRQSIALSVPELRTAFGLRDTGAERIESFRRERIARLVAGETPVRLIPGPIAVLHVAPLPSFIDREQVDIVNMVRSGTHMPLPLGAQGGNASVNLHGICNARPLVNGGTHGYGQAFRNGAYETTAVKAFAEEEPYFVGDKLAREIVQSVRYARSFLQAYGLSHPMVVMFSFVSALRLHLRVPADFGGYFDLGPLREEVIAFPEILVEHEGVEVTVAVKPVLDMVYNAFGQLGCTLYGQDGNWIGG